MALLPVPIIENGMPGMTSLDGYWPGDPLPDVIYRNDDNKSFRYDPDRDAYLPYTPPPPPPKPVGVGGVLAGLIYGVFLLGFCGLLLVYLWWLIIPVAIIAGIVKLLKS